MDNPKEQSQSKDPMHGVKLADMLEALVEHYGWEDMGYFIDIRCFNYDPSIRSSLAFLRKTPWARAKVEQLYLDMLEDKRKYSR
ncbi:MAG: VF530 family protein [Flavobacteriales bacterium]|nr:VF530 family protein [Flavobacteriales bacterium]